MKHISYLIGLCLLLSVGCSRETEEQLMGKWQLREVVTASGVQQVDTVWYNFQTSLFQLQVYRPATDSMQYCYGYNTLSGESELALELISDPKPVELFLPYTDWSSRQRSFHIDKLSGRELILSDNGKTYRFHKF